VHEVLVSLQTKFDFGKWLFAYFPSLVESTELVLGQTGI